MKIGINASFLRKQNTGIGQVTLNFLRKLSQFPMTNFQFPNKGVEFILYLEEDVDLDLPPNFHKKIFLPPYKRDDLIRKIWWEKYLLPKKVREDGCKIFLSLYQSATVLLDAGVEHIMIVHDIIPKLFPEYLNNFRKKIYQKFIETAIKKTNKIIAVSRRSEKDLIQHLGIDAKKITISYIDADEIYKKEISEEEGNKVLKKYNLKEGYIFSGGGMEVRKNIESVLRAYKILAKKSGSDDKLPKLVIYGKLMPKLAPLAVDAEKLIEEFDLRDEVILLDHTPQKDLPALFKNASMFVYPSKYEGFGLPVLEAMNQGTPVITAKTSSLPEVGADAVLYCNPEDIDDLAMVMRNLLGNNHLKLTLSGKGVERAKHFSWDKFTEKILNIINESKKLLMND